VLTRVDPGINFSWGDPGSPDPSVNVDDFSARWVADLEVAVSDTYTLWTYTDDGVMLWFDGDLVIDNWTDHGDTWNSSQPIALTAGDTHSIEMWWYERGGGATAQLHWSTATMTRQPIPPGPLSLPLKASRPHPANGAVDVKHTPTLSWSAGQEAAQHDVYLGTDQDAVANADTASAGIYRGRQALDATSYVPTESPLQWGATYYWRIDEVNGVDVWKGGLWRFTTANCLIVDDFEEYDDFCNRIFYKWKDGWGYSADTDCGVTASTGNGTGSTVGNLAAPYAEQTIVHGGNQSMPYEYNNTGTGGKARYSEASLEFATPQNWTSHDIKALSLWFHGEAGNAAETLYVALEDSTGQVRVATHPNPRALQVTSWRAWYIDLQHFSGVNLASVKKFYLGVGNRTSPQAGGSGKLYIDDIRVCPPTCVPSLAKPDADLNGDCVVDYLDVEIMANAWLGTGLLFTPQDPGSDGLVAYYPLDGDTLDASGNGHHGTAVGGPAVVAGPAGLGTALTFTPAAGDDWVECGTWDPSEGTGQLSVSLWMNWNGVSGEYMGLIGKRDTWAADDMMWHIEATQADGAVNVGREPGPFIYGYGVPEIGVWEHVAFAFDGDEIKVYRDGAEVGSGAFSFGTDPESMIVFGCCEAGGGNPFNGALDEIRLYNRALSAEEVAWLSGRTSPFSEPYDFNVDGVVDFSDYAVLSDAWLEEILWP